MSDENDDRHSRRESCDEDVCTSCGYCCGSHRESCGIGGVPIGSTQADRLGREITRLAAQNERLEAEALRWHGEAIKQERISEMYAKASIDAQEMLRLVEEERDELKPGAALRLCGALVRAWEARRCAIDQPGSVADYALCSRQRGIQALVDAITEGKTPEQVYAEEKGCGCLETYPQLIKGKVSHGPGCKKHPTPQL